MLVYINTETMKEFNNFIDFKMQKKNHKKLHLLESEDRRVFFVFLEKYDVNKKKYSFQKYYIHFSK